MRTLRQATILGSGIKLPEKVLTNFDLEKMVDTSDEWIVTRTGIKERRILGPDQKTTDLAIPAAEEALRNSGIKPEQIGAVLLATFTPDRCIAPSAPTIAYKLGCKNAAASDIQTACSGFIYATSIGANFVATGMVDYVLVIGADASSKMLDFTDRTTCVLFGDGAGAIVLGPAQNPQEGIFDMLLGADGGGAPHITIPAGGSKLPASLETVQKRLHYIKMNGKEVFKFSTRIVPDMLDQVLTRNKLTLDDVKLIVPHQANTRIIESAAARLKCPVEKFYMNLDKYGNTVAASIPIAMHEALSKGLITEGDIIFFVGFGGGLSWGTIALRWGSYHLS